MFDIFRRLTLIGYISRKSFLFALFMVSFTVQKLIGFIQPKPIFAFISTILGGLT